MKKFNVVYVLTGLFYMLGTVGGYVDKETLSFSQALLLGIAGVMLLFAGMRKDN